MEKVCGIYKITSPTKKIYIGRSVHILSRWRAYKLLHCKGQRLLYNSFKKYGFENHICEIIEVCAELELNNKEKYYIELFQSFNSQYGMNLKEGGNYAKLSLETKIKIGNSNRGKKNSIEARKKIGDKNRGKKLSQETKDKISKNSAKIHLGKFMSKETRLKMSESKKKPILQYTKQGIFIKEWASLTEASGYYKYSFGTISDVCSNKRKSANGFVWKYR